MSRAFKVKQSGMDFEFYDLNMLNKAMQAARVTKVPTKSTEPSIKDLESVQELD